MSAVRPLLAAALGAALGGCAEGPADPGPRLEVVAVGALERGLPVVLRLVADGDTVPVAEVTWSVSPAAAATLGAGDTVRLREAGPLRVDAAWDGRTATATLDVARPPEIVFDMRVDGNRDVWRAALDGGDLVRLTTAPADDYDPTAAGGAVVFVSVRDGNGELYRVPADGGAAARLTQSAENEEAPALSADGARLAFARSVGAFPRIWTSAADLSGAARATGTYGGGVVIETAPAWAPGGSTELAFMSTAAGDADVWRVVPGGTPSPLAASPDADVEPAWGANGTVAFVSDRAGDADLYLMDAGGGAATRLTSRAGAEGQPAWVDADRLVLTVWTGTTPSLAWIDRNAPDVLHPIPLPGPAQNAAPLVP